MEYPARRSLPGKPHTNGIIEQCVGRVARGTRALLQASGLPEGLWPSRPWPSVSVITHRKPPTANRPGTCVGGGSFVHLWYPSGPMSTTFPYHDNTSSRKDKVRTKDSPRSEFGDAIIMDFLSNHKEHVEGLHNQTEALVIYDLHTK